MIDRRLGPVRALGCRDFRTLRGYKRPELSGLVEVDRFFDRRRLTKTRIGSPAAYPFDKVSDDLIRELATRWHLGRLVAKGLEDQALVAFPRNQGGPGIATLRQSCCGL